MDSWLLRMWQHSFHSLSCLKGFLVDSVEFYKNFTKDFPDIRKIWETFDQAPKKYPIFSWINLSLSEMRFCSRKCLLFLYKEADVFRDFFLLIRGGQKTALVGHSGSGKTTLIKMLAGYIEPTSGSIHIDGMDFRKSPSKPTIPTSAISHKNQECSMRQSGELGSALERTEGS